MTQTVQRWKSSLCPILFGVPQGSSDFEEKVHFSWLNIAKKVALHTSCIVAASIFSLRFLARQFKLAGSLRDKI